MDTEAFRDWLRNLLSRAADEQDARGHPVRIEALNNAGEGALVVAFSDDTTKTITITDGGTS